MIIKLLFETYSVLRYTRFKNGGVVCFQNLENQRNIKD